MSLIAQQYAELNGFRTVMAQQVSDFDHVLIMRVMQTSNIHVVVHLQYGKGVFTSDIHRISDRGVRNLDEAIAIYMAMIAELKHE